MNYKKFSKIYSNARVSRYVKAANGDKRKAQKMYYANARIAQSFQPLLSFLVMLPKMVGDMQDYLPMP